MRAFFTAPRCRYYTTFPGICELYNLGNEELPPRQWYLVHFSGLNFAQTQQSAVIWILLCQFCLFSLIFATGYDTKNIAILQIQSFAMFFGFETSTKCLREGAADIANSAFGCFAMFFMQVELSFLSREGARSRRMIDCKIAAAEYRISSKHVEICRTILL